MATYGYTRVSTLKQVEDGKSLGDQQDDIRAFCKRQGWAIETIFEERAVSATKTWLKDRPQGLRLMGRLEHGDRVVVAAYDRLFRRNADAAVTCDLFEALGVDLHALSINGGGELVHTTEGLLIRNVISALSQGEAKTTGRRIAIAKKAMRARGEFMGGEAPYGYKVCDDGSLCERPGAQDAFRLAEQSQADGMGLRSIAKLLFATYPDLGDLSHMTVKKIIGRRKGKLPGIAAKGLAA